MKITKKEFEKKDKALDVKQGVKEDSKADKVKDKNIKKY